MYKKNSNNICNTVANFNFERGHLQKIIKRLSIFLCEFDTKEIVRILIAKNITLPIFVDTKLKQLKMFVKF